MLEGIIIGFASGVIIPAGIGLMGARFIWKNPDVFGKILARKMMQGAHKAAPKKTPVA